MIVKLLTEHHLEFLSLKAGCTGSSEYTHDKMPHCWKSHALAHLVYWQDEIAPLENKWAGFEPFSLPHASLLSPSLWEE